MLRILLLSFFLNLLEEALCANDWFYGDPANGCVFSEEKCRIAGTPGWACCPKCQAGNVCPTTPLPPNVPSQTIGECFVGEPGSSTNTLCILTCNPGTPGSCGTAPYATCSAIQGSGICTYVDPLPSYSSTRTPSPTLLPSKSSSPTLSLSITPTSSTTLTPSFIPNQPPSASSASSITSLAVAGWSATGILLLAFIGMGIAYFNRNSLSLGKPEPRFGASESTSLL